MKNILVIEDDKDILRLVSYSLEKGGLKPTGVASGEEGLEALRKISFDLIVLDVMLPGMDGLEVCRRLREDARTRHTPVIMLTAKGEEVDRVVGLELGADDYMVKPFSPRELVLRVKAILRRAGADGGSRSVFKEGPLVLDVSAHSAMVDGRTINLAAKEFDLLALLMRRKGRVQTREDLLAEVWDIHTEVSTRTVDTHVKRLREKLGKAGKLIDTVIGVGYRLSQDDDED